MLKDYIDEKDLPTMFGGLSECDMNTSIGPWNDDEDDVKPGAGADDAGIVLAS